MLSNFIICVNAVLPLALYLIIGIILKATKVISEDEVKRFTHVCFLALYPFIMFNNIYGKDIKSHINLGLLGFSVIFVIFQIAVSIILVCKIEKSNYNRGAMIQAMWRSNAVLMALSIGASIFGKNNITEIVFVVMIVVPLYNAMAVVLLESFRGGKADVRKIIKGVLTNPIILGGIAALITVALNITLPSAVEATVESLSDATTVIAMILLGASLKIKAIKSDRAKLVICVFMKLIAFPAMGIAAALLFGYRGVELAAIVLITATPTALASYAMASSMGSNGELAGECVVFSTCISCITLPLWLFVLMNGGLL